MNHLIRAALIVALGLGTNVLCGDAWADEDPSAVTEPSPDETREGAGGLEPAEAIDEDGGTGAHKAWVESIWSTP
jgi:hypothetical protein